MKILNIVIAVALVGLTGCAGLFVNSGNTTVLPGSNEIQSPAPTSRANNLIPVKKASGPGTNAQNPDGKIRTSPPPAAGVTPTPTPTAKPPVPPPQVIKEETTSKVEVISSRPVVGTDAEMGN